MLKEFTFGICTFNSAEFILEALESVRYQIVNYGNYIDCYLVISDDCSSDRTIDLTRSWCDANKDIFKDIKILTSDVNQGIAKNYPKLLREINTEYFKTIDGDDLLSCNNIFKTVSCLNNELFVCLPLKLKNEDIFVDSRDKSLFFYNLNKEFSHKQSINQFITEKHFYTPEILAKRLYYTDECLTYTEKYNQFEDDTSIYYILKNNPDVKIRFLDKPLVIYRIHDSSLSNGKISLGQILFMDDLHNYRKDCFKDCRNFLSKLYLILLLKESFLIKHRFKSKNKLKNMINCIYDNDALKYCNKNKKSFEIFEKKIEVYVNEENNYLSYIKNRIKQYQ